MSLIASSGSRAAAPATSPHGHEGRDTAWIMQQVLLAMLPGIVALTGFFGWGTLLNMAVASATAVACEAAMVALRKRPVGFYLRDCSALVTALLIAVTLPPLAPWWLTVIATGVAIVIAKHLYGGLGYNPFNPAMAGYVVVLISFPVPVTAWPAPQPLLPTGQELLGLWDALGNVFPFLAGAEGHIDAVTAATPLDAFKHNHSLMVDQFYQVTPVLIHGHWAGAGWEWVNLGFLAGGLYLLYRKVFSWHAPVAMLVALAVLAMAFYDGGSSVSTGPPTLHLLSGGTMLGAFFIVTDPVTSAVSSRGRLIYGALIGVLIFVIRSWGNYPDAVAFAVLLMNFAAPFIDYYTLPRTYGHDQPTRATAPRERE